MGQKPRTIPPARREELVEELSAYAATPVVVASVVADEEAVALADQIAGILREAGWDVDGVNQTDFIPAPEGIIIQTPDERTAVVALGDGLVESGLALEGRLTQDRDDVKVVVGTNG